MPNIEMHGIKDDMSYGQLFHQIKKALQDAPYAKDIVLTDYQNRVVDFHEKSQPYLRLVALSTSSAELEDIEKRLEPLNIDIEVLLIDHFTPKKPLMPDPDGLRDEANQRKWKVGEQR